MRLTRLAGLLTFALTLSMNASMTAGEMTWQKLAPLPDPEGFAAMYAGVSGNSLVVAGGAHFPGKRPWEGGTKVWYDDVWCLASPDGNWLKIGKLPRPLGYGVSVTWRDEVVCAGGSNASGHRNEVFALSIKNGRLVTRELPSLPLPCANMCGSLVGNILYLAGGIEKPDATQALHTFWSLDLATPGATWLVLPAWPGEPRMLATAGSHRGAFYLFSGASLHADEADKPARSWLKDAYRYQTEGGWRKLSDLPRVAVAPPSPAPANAEGLLVLTGDDGTKAGFRPETLHPGFPRDALFYSPALDRWSTAGSVPFSRATVPVAFWQGGFVVPSGEARPGYRSPEVWLLKWQ